jgi:oxygen-independent coproporphyrinogen-3 oxidase
MNAAHVYVHVPFCARRCSYCDFAIAVRKVVPVDRYLTAIQTEIDRRHPDARPGRVETIYLGGGTPSRLGGSGIARLLAVLHDRFDVASDAEITMEINPDDITPEDVGAWRAAGVNRASVGAQSFSDHALQWMHRTHDAGAIARAVETLRASGIRDCSVDLIFALPDHVQRDWRTDLERAIALEPTHVSLYGLTIEPKTPIDRMRARGEVIDAPEERYESDYLLAHEMLTGVGFDHYEVSNFGRPGHRARHNSAYWRAVPYVALGPGAHEFDGDRRRWNDRAYEQWASRLESGEDPIEGFELLTGENRRLESIYLGLRTSAGLSLTDSGAERVLVDRWCREGWATVSDDRIQLTALGWMRLDALCASLTVRGSR